MELKCSFGTIVCNDVSEIEKTIKKCASNPHDEIWLRLKEEFPSLAILINGESACLQFFESNEKNYHSVGDEKSDGMAKFYFDGVLSEIPDSMVISLSSAIECAKQFFISHDRSSCIKWNVL